MEIDIATLLENHRRHMLAIVSDQDYDNEDELAASRFAVMSAHDRATTKALLDLYRTASSTQPGCIAGGLGNTALPTPITTVSRKVKAGSKKARDRAIKAGETRRRNLAEKANQSTTTTTTIAGGHAGSQDATHTIPQDGGAA